MRQIDRLLAIMQRLRNPELGCSWDNQQTFATLAPHTLEETCEVLDAIAREDFDDLRGELGDLLFQVVFYSRLAQEAGRFDFDAVCEAIADKLERRHPHIFGDRPDAAAIGWEAHKREERARKARHSALDEIPLAMPALMRAHKIQERCAGVGFDWDRLGPVLDKVHEEIDEVMHEAGQAVIDRDKLEEEVGDLLFASVNLARHLGTHAETALMKANRKFERRFRRVEAILAAQGTAPCDASLERMEAAWQHVKSEEHEP